jgi:hypothetical protein
MSKEEHANDYRQDNRDQLEPEMRHVLCADQADPLNRLSHTAGPGLIRDSYELLDHRISAESQRV